VSWINDTGYVVFPLDGVNGVRHNLVVRIGLLAGCERHTAMLRWSGCPKDRRRQFKASMTGDILMRAIEFRVLNELFGCATRVVTCEELRRDFVNEAEAVGAVHGRASGGQRMLYLWYHLRDEAS
jgi:hypothetical protein